MFQGQQLVNAADRMIGDNWRSQHSWNPEVSPLLMCVRLFPEAAAKIPKGSVKGPIRTSPSFLIMAADCPPCHIVSTSCPMSSYFHGGNTGSNPVGDAKLPKHFSYSRGSPM